MPIQTRCPSCAAAIPTNAAWCSLCHSDLRPRPAPRQSPAAPVTIVVAPVHGTVLEDTRPDDPRTTSTGPTTGLDDHDDLDDVELDLDDEPVPVGRHSREAPSPAPAAPRPARALPSRGKHAGSGRRAAEPRRRAAVDLDDLALPAPGEATPEQVDDLADQMLTRLALTEPQPRLLDPDDFPGGRWGLAGAGLAAVAIVLLVLYTVAGLLFS